MARLATNDIRMLLVAIKLAIDVATCIVAGTWQMTTNNAYNDIMCIDICGHVYDLLAYDGILALANYSVSTDNGPIFVQRTTTNASNNNHRRRDACNNDNAVNAP